MWTAKTWANDREATCERKGGKGSVKAPDEHVLNLQNTTKIPSYSEEHCYSYSAVSLELTYYYMDACHLVPPVSLLCISTPPHFTEECMLYKLGVCLECRQHNDWPGVLRIFHSEIISCLEEIVFSVVLFHVLQFADKVLPMKINCFFVATYCYSCVLLYYILICFHWNVYSQLNRFACQGLVAHCQNLFQR